MHFKYKLKIQIISYNGNKHKKLNFKHVILFRKVLKLYMSLFSIKN